MKPAQLFGLAALLLPIGASAVSLSDTTRNAASIVSKRDTVSTILADIENAATCTACEVRLHSLTVSKAQI